MTEVVSVRFKNKGKVYYFNPAGITVEKGMSVIVETSKGLEYAECTRGNHMVEDSAVVPPLRPVIRIATPEDDQRAADNHKKEEEAFAICNEKILKHELDMKLVDVEYNFEGTKILFFFTSDGRVDFRDLVKDLAAVFKTRIELRQIGVRDEARMLNGLGICGRPFCCAQFLDDFQPVSIKMAKTQGLSLNPAKISGTCGRLMCCLKYEQEAYEELVKAVPKVDSFVETPQGKGMVTDVNLLRSKVRVKLEEQSDTTLKMFDAADVKVIGGKAARAEYLAAKVEEKSDEPVKEPVPERKRPVNNKKSKLSDYPGFADTTEENIESLAPVKQENILDDKQESEQKQYSDGLNQQSENDKHELPSGNNKPRNRRRQNYKPKSQISKPSANTEQDKAGNTQHHQRKKQNQQQKPRQNPTKQQGGAESENAGEKPTNKRPFRYRRFRNNNNKKGDSAPKQQ